MGIRGSELRGRALAHPRYPRAAATAAVAALAMPLAGPAGAQERIPDNNAGTGQYVEPVPDAGGDRRARPGEGRPTRPLPPQTREQLPPGREGQILERLGTDPGSGAQDAAASDDADSDGGGAGGRDGGPRGGKPLGEERGAVAAGTSAIVDSDDATIPMVAIALLGLTLGTAVAVLARRRRRA